MSVEGPEGPEGLEGPEPKWSGDQLTPVADRIHTPVAVLEADGTLLYVNDAAAYALKEAPQHLIGRRLLDLVHPEDRARVDREFRRVVAGRLSGGMAVFRLRAAPFGPWRTIEAIVDNMLDNPAIAGILVSSRDITDQRAHEADLQRAAYRDPLTGLSNRAEITLLLEELITTTTPLAVIFVGLDRFKLINDSLGHAAGDDVLKVVSSRLVESFPASAVVGRFGADIFVVLLHGSAAALARELAWRAVERLSEPLFLPGHELRLSASAGIAHKDGASTADSLLRDADLALHRSKVAGGGRVQLFEPAMREETLARLEMEADLRQAVAHSELSLALQPIVRLDDGHAVGAEALVRWQRRGVTVEPSQFVEVAEQTGLIVAMGEWIIDEAAQLALSAPGGRLTVNLSARQLASPGLPQRIARALRSHQLEPWHLDFEITESLVITQTDYVVEVLKSIRALGCRVGLDDFGTGYSSLGYLRRLPIDFLKLDGSLIEGVDHDRQALAIVGAVVNMADALGLGVIAECVESEMQARALMEAGCEFGQGFLYGRPAEF
jgi:diguanylate cyclase (GGDEF)-like protein/PAS domain S-box-containing protein